MAIKLEDKTNVLAPNADYQYGNIKDDTGVGDGTLVDVEVYADMHQFFARLLDQSGVVANGLPDNTTNGFQLYEALRKLVAEGLPNDPSGAWITGGTITLLPDAGTASLPSIAYNKYKIIGKTFYWQIIAALTVTGSPNTVVFGYPAAITIPSVNPAAPRKIMAFYKTGQAICEVLAAGMSMTVLPAAAFSGSNQYVSFSLVTEIN